MSSGIQTMMERFRERGWLVSLKVAPQKVGWIIEPDSRSEYDGPSRRGHHTTAYAGKWVAEAEWHGSSDWLPGRCCINADPKFALRQLWQECLKVEAADHERKQREAAK